MILLDAYAIIAFLVAGPAAPHVRALLRQGGTGVAGPISLADAILLATARSGDRLATADPDVLAVAAAEGLGTVELPGQG